MIKLTFNRGYTSEQYKIKGIYISAKGAKMENPINATSVENEEEEQPCPTCHMVANPDSQFWICCDECNTWYHDVCEGLTSMVTSDTYICLSCRKKRCF